MNQISHGEENIIKYLYLKNKNKKNITNVEQQ